MKHKAWCLEFIDWTRCQMKISDLIRGHRYKYTDENYQMIVEILSVYNNECNPDCCNLILQQNLSSFTLPLGKKLTNWSIHIGVWEHLDQQHKP